MATSDWSSRSAAPATVFDAAIGKLELEEDLDIAGGSSNVPLSPDGKILARSTGRNAVDLIDVGTLQ